MGKKEGKHWKTVLDYAHGILEGSIIANTERKQAAQRFLNDLNNPEYEIDHTGPTFCIDIIESTLCHQQGERIDGTPLRGSPLKLLPFQKFIIYNLVGFIRKDTKTVRFHEALIYIPRKNGKTAMAAALAWALSLWYRNSGSKCYIASAALMQSLESFNFLVYNVDRMGERQQRGKPGGSIKIIDNNNEHSMQCNIGGGSFFIRALAANPDAQDSLNCNIAITDRYTCPFLPVTT